MLVDGLRVLRFGEELLEEPVLCDCCKALTEEEGNRFLAEPSARWQNRIGGEVLERTDYGELTNFKSESRLRSFKSG